MRGLALLSTLTLAQGLPSLRAGMSNYGDEDAWVFSRVWYPQVCATSPKPLCNAPTSYLRTHLVAEDLIPAYSDGTTQSGLCRYEYGTFRPASIASVGEDKLKQYFPFANAPDPTKMWSGGFDGNTPSYSWTCGGIHQAAYLDTVVRLTIAAGTPGIISENINGEIDTESLRKALTGENGAAPVLICQDNKLLRVLSCYDKNQPSLATTTDPTYEPTKPIACPAAWQQQESCSQSTVHITGL